MPDSSSPWSALLTHPSLLLPHPNPHPFTVSRSFEPTSSPSRSASVRSRVRRIPLKTSSSVQMEAPQLDPLCFANNSLTLMTSALPESPEPLYVASSANHNENDENRSDDEHRDNNGVNDSENVGFHQSHSLEDIGHHHKEDSEATILPSSQYVVDDHWGDTTPPSGTIHPAVNDKTPTNGTTGSFAEIFIGPVIRKKVEEGPGLEFEANPAVTTQKFTRQRSSPHITSTPPTTTKTIRASRSVHFIAIDQVEDSDPPPLPNREPLPAGAKTPTPTQEDQTCASFLFHMFTFAAWLGSSSLSDSPSESDISNSGPSSGSTPWMGYYRRRTGTSPPHPEPPPEQSLSSNPPGATPAQCVIKDTHPESHEGPSRQGLEGYIKSDSDGGGAPPNSNSSRIAKMTADLTSSQDSLLPPTSYATDESLSTPPHTLVLDPLLVHPKLMENEKQSTEVEKEVDTPPSPLSTPPPSTTWTDSDAAFYTPPESEESSSSTSTSTSASTAVSTSSACGTTSTLGSGSPPPPSMVEVVRVGDNAATTVPASRTPPKFLRRTSKRCGTGQSSNGGSTIRRRRSAGVRDEEVESIVDDGVCDAHGHTNDAVNDEPAPPVQPHVVNGRGSSTGYSTHQPTNSRKQTSKPTATTKRSTHPYAHKHKHKRTASFGEAASSLLSGVALSVDVNWDKENEKEKANGKGKEKENEDTFTAEPISSKRARFMILGSESDVDLPSSLALASSPPQSPSSAWSTSSSTQDPSSSFSSSPTSPPSSTSTHSHRPVLVRHDALINAHESTGRQRWTLASAMTDEGVSDAGLMRDLETMREVGVWEADHERELMLLKERDVDSRDGDGGVGGAVPLDGGPAWDVGQEMWDGRGVGPTISAPSSTTTSTPSSSASRLTAQRALLACRELILTERHYHALLLSLLAGDTYTPPPSSMQHYAAELERASAGVLRAMERQPSASGVARAFVDNVEEMERAYVRWCEVVGGWFVGGGVDSDGSASGSGSGNVKRKRSPSVVDSSPTATTFGMDEDGGSVGSTSSKTSSGPLKRVGTWRRSMPTISSLGEATSSIYGSGSLRRRPREREKEKEKERTSEELEEGAPTNLASRPSTRVRRKPAVRDLAILPTQRVMRYVLLYRDLLSHTPPTSASRALVEKAFEVASMIAEKCDRAQGNAAFFVACGGGGGGGGTGGTSGSSVAAAAGASSSRSSSWRTAVTASSDSTAPSSVEGEQRQRQREEEAAAADGEGNLDSSDFRSSKVSTVRRTSLSIMSSMGWRGRSHSRSHSLGQKTAAI